MLEFTPFLIVSFFKKKINHLKKFTNMKKSLIAFVMITAVIITYVSCKKSDHQSPKNNNNFDVASAKEWFYANFKKSPEYTQLNAQSPIISLYNYFNKQNKGSLQKFPDWRYGVAYKKGGFEFVEFPLVYNHEVNIVQGREKNDATKAKRIINATVTKVVFIKSSGGKIDVRIVNMVPTYEYASAKGFDISHNRATLLDENFCGTIHIKKWDETIIQAQEIVDRKIKKKFVLTDAAALNNTARKANGDCEQGHWDILWVHVCFDTHVETVNDIPTVIACNHEDGENTYVGTVFICDDIDGGGDGLDQCDGIYEQQALAQCICDNYGLGCGGGGGDDGGDNCTQTQAEFQAIVNSKVVAVSNITGSTTYENGNKRTKKVSWKFLTYQNGLGATWGWESNETMKVEKFQTVNNPVLPPIWDWKFETNGITHNSYTKFGTSWIGTYTLEEKYAPDITYTDLFNASVRIYVTATESINCGLFTYSPNTEIDLACPFNASIVAIL
jgi:hypothetical protein